MKKSFSIAYSELSEHFIFWRDGARGVSGGFFNAHEVTFTVESSVPPKLLNKHSKQLLIACEALASIYSKSPDVIIKAPKGQLWYKPDSHCIQAHPLRQQGAEIILIDSGYQIREEGADTPS
ncbi:hypothetical protein [Neptuniibacter sp. QD37_11]|uniref:hypothetical protein n=1 Tax=Neptuniibacter sp. QD37_11 TaxID=3398209 RepID=UPI0039F6088E